MHNYLLDTNIALLLALIIITFTFTIMKHIDINTTFITKFTTIKIITIKIITIKITSSFFRAFSLVLPVPLNRPARTRIASTPSSSLFSILVQKWMVRTKYSVKENV